MKAAQIKLLSTILASEGLPGFLVILLGGNVCKLLIIQKPARRNFQHEGHRDTPDGVFENLYSVEPKKSDGISHSHCKSRIN